MMHLLCCVTTFDAFTHQNVMINTQTSNMPTITAITISNGVMSQLPFCGLRVNSGANRRNNSV